MNWYPVLEKGVIVKFNIYVPSCLILPVLKGTESCERIVHLA